MPKLFGMKDYDSKIDIYTSRTTQDPQSGALVTAFNYMEPETYECNIVSIRPSATLETFGSTYADSEFLKVEIKHNDAKYIALAQQAGNLRSKEGEKYYPRFESEQQYVFNIQGITPQIDPWGKIVSIELFLQLFNNNVATANGD